MCGEKGLPTLRYSPQSGSPPHVRGKGCQFWDCQKGGEDHPRMCGEKSTGILVWLEVIGSPPRMRGKAARLCLFSFFLGIAPAYAGKRLASAVVPPSSEDHSRTCGEKHTINDNMKTVKGSPPHMRGKDSVMYGLQRVHGITPAHAGKRPVWPGSSAAHRDHPRTCGEKLRARDKISAPWGSPPHMRGKVLL